MEGTLIPEARRSAVSFCEIRMLKPSPALDVPPDNRRPIVANCQALLSESGRRPASGLSIPVFLLVTFSATALSSLMPGSAAQLILGENATQAQIDALNSRYGYDLPVWERYLGWLGRLLQGDLGQTMFSQQSVAKLLVDRAAVTFEIALLAMFVSLLIGVPLAMYTAS